MPPDQNQRRTLKMGICDSKEVKRLTSDQIDWVLQDIAETAEAISCLTVELNGGAAAVGLDELLPNIISKLAQRIGFIACFAADEKPEIGDAMKWMMHPAYHQAAEVSNG
jgi:hypothetical protein